MVGLFLERIVSGTESTTWLEALRDLTAKAFSLRRVQSLEYDNLY